MRMLRRNTTPIFCIKVLSYDDEIDTNGYFTGAKIPVYDKPIEMRMSLYPANSEVARQSFGMADELDMVALSKNSFLDGEDLLFLNKPTEPIDYTKYDYKIKQKAVSLNHTLYALKKRVGV